MITLGEGLHYDVPMDVYHGNCAAGPSVSGSVLFDLHSTCPAKAIARHYLSPWPREDSDTKATAFGSAAHAMILEGPEVFAERYIVKPDGFDGRTKEGKAWMADNANRQAVSAKDFAMIQAMQSSVDE